jgi:hypothetical protein
MLESAMETQSLEQKKKQVFSAKRSLMTNLVLAITIVVLYCIILTVTVAKKGYFTILLTSFFQGVVPIFTTITNFGNLKEVASQCWKISLNKIMKLKFLRHDQREQL